MNYFTHLKIEWPTIGMITLCYGTWLVLMLNAEAIPTVLWIPITGIVLTLFWSLVHEAIHGHPTTNSWINHALLFLPLGWVYSYERFLETHLEHHSSGDLTDPFDDPESFYLAQNCWLRQNRLMQILLVINNTLAGRLLIGPLVSVPRFYVSEIQLMLAGGATGLKVVKSWLLHLSGVAILVWFLTTYTAIPFWQHALVAYIGVSLLLIRTFLEHQACEEHGERTVIIESSGPLAWLFLFNSLHAVHHTRPGIAWYLLPGFYRKHRDAFIRGNNGYVYNSYLEIFRRYFLRPKEPVPHPFVKEDNRSRQT